MKKFLLLFLICVFSCSENFAQCPGCNINTAYTSPGIYPNPLPDGTQGQPYDQDVTFVMFTDTQGLTVNYFKIISVSNLPFGLNWECNNSANGCVYDPATSIYGCVKVCGTPLQNGTYNIAVGVLANLAVVGDQSSTINIGLTINPPSGGNPSFTLTPTSGCDSISVDFDALINGTPNPTNYSWNFGNGNSGTQMHETQTYTTPGNYNVTLQTDILGFILTDVSVNSVNGNWCGDVEEPNIPFVGCSGDPDLVFIIADQGGNTIYTSSEATDMQSASWNGLNVSLLYPPFSITIWDIDVVSQNDNLGTFAFNGTSAGVFPFNGAGGTSGTITIATTVLATYNDTAIVSVFDSPAIPVISFSPNDTMCNGDTIILSISNPNNYAVQWYNDSTQIVNATANQYAASTTGNYSVVVTNSNGCSKGSAVTHITEQPTLPTITFQIHADTLQTFLTNYNLQWFLDGAPISGATNDTYIISDSGEYFLLASDIFGCERSSDTYQINYSISPNLLENISTNVYPIPAKHFIQIDIAGWKTGNADLSLIDMAGRIIYSEEISSDNSGLRKITLELKDISDGFYVLKIEGSNILIHRKIVIRE